MCLLLHTVCMSVFVCMYMCVSVNAGTHNAHRQIYIAVSTYVSIYLRLSLMLPAALWLTQLSSLSNKLLIRRLRELKPLFTSIFHNTSSFKCSPKGPLSLQEFYQFTPGQGNLDWMVMIILYVIIIHIGNDSFPLLMQPLLVGFEQDWSSVAPSAMLAWVSAV